MPVEGDFKRERHSPPRGPSDAELEVLAMLKRLRDRDLRELACRLDCDSMISGVLGWISAQRSLDMASALTLFLNAGPERFNHIAKDDAP